MASPGQYPWQPRYEMRAAAVVHYKYMLGTTISKLQLSGNGIGSLSQMDQMPGGVQGSMTVSMATII